MWLVGSDGTTPASAGGGQPQINWLARGTATVNTAATLSLVSANAGEHYVELSASEVSALGIAAVHYRAAAVLPNSTYFQIANFDSGNSQDFGLAAFSVVTLAPGTHSNVTIKGIQNFANISSVTLNPGTHSDVTIQGVTRVNSAVTIANANYSAVTVRLDLQDYSGATVGAGNITPRVYSGVSVEIKTGGIQTGSVGVGNYSGVTVEVSNLGRSSMQSMADRFLSRALAKDSDTGRNVQDALRILRNKVAIAGSTLTVYTEDDSTSAWTASISTSANASPIVSIDPGGP